jgi:hypothetical protein
MSNQHTPTSPVFDNEMAEILESFIVESNEILEKLGQDLLLLEKDSKNSELHNVPFIRSREHRPSWVLNR